MSRPFVSSWLRVAVALSGRQTCTRTVRRGSGAVSRLGPVGVVVVGPLMARAGVRVAQGGSEAAPKQACDKSNGGLVPCGRELPGRRHEGTCSALWRHGGAPSCRPALGTAMSRVPKDSNPASLAEIFHRPGFPMSPLVFVILGNPSQVAFWGWQVLFFCIPFYLFIYLPGRGKVGKFKASSPEPGCFSCVLWMKLRRP